MQALGAPGKTEKALITRKVTTIFSVSSCTPISYMSFPRPTDVSRLIIHGEALPGLFDDRYGHFIVGLLPHDTMM